MAVTQIPNYCRKRFAKGKLFTGGRAVADWMNGSVAVQPTSRSLIHPPVEILWSAIALLGLSIAALPFSNIIGYGLGVVASLAGGVTALLDQKRRADINYANKDWFSPTLRIVRYAVLVVAFSHIVLLAISAAKEAVR